MTNRPRRAPRRTGLACVLALCLATALTACGSSDDGGDDGGGPADVTAALEKGGTIKVWAWEPTLKQVAKDFEDEHPKVKVKLVNAGTNKDEYTALQNAISAGSGVPDVAQIEYYALGQFTLTESLTDLAGFGADKLGDTYSPGPWNAVSSSDGIHALPMDSGPMALFYNKDVFDKHHIAVPRTWDEYVAAARKLHKADPEVYITSDTGDPGLTTSLIWQAGGRPYTVDGTEVSIDFSDQGSATYTRTWQKLIDDKLLAPTVGWSDEWYKGLSDGKIATLPIGAWMPANLMSGAPKGKGSWRVAPLPQWKPGKPVSAENGGSALAVPTKSGNKALAYAFVQYANAGKGVKTRVHDGAFPATKATLESKEFLNRRYPYFGGQKANVIFSKAAADVPDDWSYLPFQVYANSVFNDAVGTAYTSGTPLDKGLADWRKASVKYGKEQGFTIE
ncbi:ABC transporter substrate-binding protein [Streptomyces cucumeris]|uniref:ABC transporter substrate-binding protein n=1 Tax=Streptomyces cucumeris TaxID=2962890 RepID=UPI0020C85970|nr:sugar ABC transporter substrate-binding protein [Streptomyces sp. NEAU-Y11]MCP9211202.1 sugar ABC transporter substrate-binding protein [Streptomyces sp. NEAU-Y11]